MSKSFVMGKVKPLAAGVGTVLAVLLIVAGLSVLTTIIGGGAVARAEALSHVQLGTLPEGEITAVGQTTIDVDGKMYGLHPKLTIVSDAGQPMELKQLRPGLIVQYHVKEGGLDRIIVLIPR